MKKYICEITEESLSNKKILQKINKFLVKKRISKNVRNTAATRHIREYHVPTIELNDLINELKKNIKKEWYSYIFNVADNILFVIMTGKCFILPTQKNASWQKMIAYGQQIGIEKKYLENIPLENVA